MPEDKQEKCGTAAGLERIVFFSDAVVAIAITLMVLDIRVPESIAPHELADTLQATIPTFISYILSFLIVAVYWVEHHRMFRYITRYDSNLMWTNLVFLGLIMLVPFATDVVDRYTEDEFAVIMCALLLAAIGLIIAGMWWYVAHRHRLIDEDISERMVRTETGVRLIAPAVFLASIPLAFFAAEPATYTWFVIFPLMSVFRRRL